MSWTGYGPEYRYGTWRWSKSLSGSYAGGGSRSGAYTMKMVQMEDEDGPDEDGPDGSRQGLYPL
jgi:hypothetical protein